MKLVVCNYRRSVQGPVSEILIEGNQEKRAGHIIKIPVSSSLQCPDGVVASLAAAAVKVDRTILWNFLHPFPQLGKRDIPASFQMSLIILSLFTDIYNECPLFHQLANHGNRHLPVFAVKQCRL